MSFLVGWAGDPARKRLIENGARAQIHLNRLPMLNAQCSMPNAQCPMPNAQIKYPLDSAQSLPKLCKCRSDSKVYKAAITDWLVQILARRLKPTLRLK
jgi:hypothetical protein